MGKNIIDISKLENVKSLGAGIYQSACPFCRAVLGKDADGNHLKIWQNGAFNCIVAPKDREHNRGILQLAGTEGDGNVDYYYEPEPKLKTTSYYPDSILNKLVKDHSYWIKRGVSEQTIAQFEGGVALPGSGKLADRYVFPLRDKTGKIMAFSGRYIHEIKKNSKVVKWKHIHKVANSLFPLNLAKNEIIRRKEVILVESIGDCLAMYDNGIKNVLVLFGINISSSLMSYLVGANPNRIIIATNNDELADKNTVGNDAADEIYGKLSNIFDKSKLSVCLPNKKDFGEMSREDFGKWKVEHMGSYGDIATLDLNQIN